MLTEITSTDGTRVMHDPRCRSCPHCNPAMAAHMRHWRQLMAAPDPPPDGYAIALAKRDPTLPAASSGQPATTKPGDYLKQPPPDGYATALAKRKGQ